MKSKSQAKGRIVFLSASSGVWGAEESLLTLAKALRKDGQEVALVCFAGPLADRWESDLGITAILSGSRDDPDSSKLATALDLWRTYIRVAASGDALVMFTYYLVALAPVARLLLFPRRVTLVLDMHDNLGGRKGRIALQVFSSSVQRIIAVSGFTANQFGPHKSRVSVLTRPVDQAHPGAPEHIPSAGPNDVVRIGIVGRLTRGKGHELLLRAATRLAGDFALVVRGAGDGSTEDVESEVIASGQELLGDQFVFEGSVPRTLVMDGLDILVVANDKEPLGRTVIEAQLSGVVAVVPDAGGSSELVVDELTGCKYSSGDDESLARVLSSLIHDSGRRRAIAMRAKGRAAVTASPTTYARSYLSAICGA